jgi:Ni2+-binding GTPase involved in maturation of urease and hydrogenase
MKMIFIIPTEQGWAIIGWKHLTLNNGGAYSLRCITVTGTPSAGKTSIILHTIKQLLQEEIRVAACKIDTLETSDDERYRQAGIPVVAGLSQNICPDHFYVTNLVEIFDWAKEQEADILVIETAGLCHRCAPAVNGCLSVCVIDNLCGIDTPKKVGPMLATADVTAITKGDIVSQAEREVFRRKIEMVNPVATIIEVNGLTGQGSLWLKKEILSSPHIDKVDNRELRYPMPSAVCSYCNGETMIGASYQMGNVKKIDFGRVR